MTRSFRLQAIHYKFIFANPWDLFSPIDAPSENIILWTVVSSKGLFIRREEDPRRWNKFSLGLHAEISVCVVS